MCVITVSLALCDTTWPYPDADIPAGCLKIYPFTSGEVRCPESQCVLGSCGGVEMSKAEGKDGNRIDKRICESCVAWSALMRNKDGRKAGRRAAGRRAEGRGELDSDGLEVIVTPAESPGSSEFELEVDNGVLGETY